jgi:hypothetical protein
MEGTMGIARDPKWWSEQHGSTWERVKAALQRDWEQTKNDVSSSRGRDLDQDVGDTVKQAAGKQPVPPITQRTPEDWERVEPAVRYGFGAGHQYRRDFPEWDDRLETKLRQEWTDLKTGQTWDEMKGFVRRGWDRARSIGRDAH